MTNLEIIIDTREQTPWSFPSSLVAVTRATLKQGDYALAGDDLFAVERKNLDDFIGTIASDQKRFERQLKRMEGHVARCIIVEGRLLNCCFYEGENGELEGPEHNHCMITPQFILKQVAILTMNGISVLFAENAEIAAGLGFAVLLERWNQINGIHTWLK